MILRRPGRRAVTLIRLPKASLAAVSCTFRLVPAAPLDRVSSFPHHETNPVNGEPAGAARLRVVTYNIHKGIGGVDRRYRLERIVEVLSHCAADVVLLQEVDDGVPRSRRDCQFELLAEALELKHFAYQANVKLRHGRYGNAILSRFPLYDTRDLEMTVLLKKRRRALVAHCRLPIGEHVRSVLLFNFHLGLAGYERTIQLRRFLASEILLHAHRDTPVVAGGDFNDVWGTLGRRLLEPAGFASVSRDTKTFPAFYPMRPLDRLYYRGSLTLDHSFASRTQVAQQASDHLPLVAEFFVSAERRQLTGQESQHDGAETDGGT
jgi:endonuclease/exonuclease/phosphatase family metal-dependent hydrolase